MKHTGAAPVKRDEEEEGQEPEEGKKKNEEKKSKPGEGEIGEGALEALVTSAHHMGRPFGTQAAPHLPHQVDHLHWQQMNPLWQDMT